MATRLENLLEQLATELASEIPANPASKRNERLADSLKAELANYFKSLEAAFPFAEIEKIYLKLAGPDIAEVGRDPNDIDRDSSGKFVKQGTGAPIVKGKTKARVITTLDVDHTSPDSEKEAAKSHFIQNRVLLDPQHESSQSGIMAMDAVQDRLKRLPADHFVGLKSVSISDEMIENYNNRWSGVTYKGRACAYYDKNTQSIVTDVKNADYSITHEVGHHVQYGLAPSDRVEIVKYYNVARLTNTGFVSNYSRTNDREFFAESYERFVKDRPELDAVNPYMGRLLSGVFGE